MSFHHSPLNAERIQRVIYHLQIAGDAGLTTADLNEVCGSTRASSDISEARAALEEKNAPIYIRTDYVGTNGNGRRVFRYTLQEYPVEKDV